MTSPNISNEVVFVKWKITGAKSTQLTWNGYDNYTTIIACSNIIKYSHTQFGEMHVTALQLNCTNLHTVAISLLYGRGLAPLTSQNNLQSPKLTYSNFVDMLPVLVVRLFS